VEDNLCQDQESWNIYEKLLKKELPIGFSPREGFFPGCEPTSSVNFLYAIALVIA